MLKKKSQPIYRSNLYYYGNSKPQNVVMEHQKKSSKAAKFAKLLIVIAVLLVATDLTYSKLTKHAKAANTTSSPPTTLIITSPSHSQNTVPTVDITQLSSTINSVISQNSNIDMSVSLIDLDNGQSANFGDSSRFVAASVAKILTAADFLHQVEGGHESLSETINGNSAEYEIQQMIVVSDDTAWEDLNEELGYQNLSNYGATIGITYGSSNNTLDTADTAHILAELWAGKLLNSQDTQLLLGYMKQANYREYIVPAVPSSDTIYHKAGLYQDEVNDAAIITNDKKAFAIVIFTNGNGVYNWPARAQMMQTIASAAITTYLQ